jgi:HNH endonuclease
VKHSLFALLETATASVWPREYTWLFILIGILAGLNIVVKQWVRDKGREKRRTYYRDTYLNSDDWKRKRALVLKRDNYRCVYCGARATQVHHKQYARRNIGREPIEWLVSVCKSCHDQQHERE